MVKDQIQQLTRRILDGNASGIEVERELRALLHAFDGVYYREKVREAIEWAGIYFSARKSQRHGGEDKVLSILLGALSSAEREAGRLESESC
jgi:hypothetical protein